MTTTDPLSQFGTKQTPQRQQAPDRPEQVKNNAGGFVFKINPLEQFKRFLVMGTTGGTYYVGQDALTQEVGNMVLTLTRDEETQIKAIDILTEISLDGRAAKQNPTLFSLAIFCQHGTTEAKQHARKQITKVVRTGTHLFIFVRYLKQFGGWSRGLRKAVGAWYTEKEADKLALQLVKYRQREGYTHRDVLRLTHPKIDEPSKRAAIDWTLGKPAEAEHVPHLIYAFDAAQDPGNRDDIPRILETNRLPWEALPDSAMNDVNVWRKLLDNGVPPGALLRQLPRLTNLGLLDPMAQDNRVALVVKTLTDREALSRARMHPINVLIALKTYSGGRSLKGTTTWHPSTMIIDALDDMFYASFEFVEPTNLRLLQAIDISGSMGNGYYSQIKDLPLTPAEVAGAMAMVTAKTEMNQLTMGFSSLSGHNSRDPKDSKLVDLNVSPRQRLDDVIRHMYDRTFGGTDVALPMVHALERGWSIDTFVVYTDNETWHGNIHPFQALKNYRRVMGIDAKLIVVAMTPTQFSVADPSDPGMLDIAGFDAGVPQMIADFSQGVI